MSTIILGQMISNIVKRFPDDHNPCHCQMALLAYPEFLKKYKTSRLRVMLYIMHLLSNRSWRWHQNVEEQKSDKQAITKCVIDALATF